MRSTWLRARKSNLRQWTIVTSLVALLAAGVLPAEAAKPQAHSGVSQPKVRPINDGRQTASSEAANKPLRPSTDTRAAKPEPTDAKLATGDAVYAYDAAGRMVGVTDPDGETARYRYDAAGNRTDVDRFASSKLSVLSVVPTTARPGAKVTLSGTGFSTSAVENSVTFGGKTATVVSASSQKIVAEVPSDVPSGTVSVASAGATAQSLETFTPSKAAPTVTGIAPASGVPGTEVILSGSGFETALTENLVRFNGGVLAEVKSRTDSSLTVVVPAGANTGRVQVETPTGTAASPDFTVPIEGEEFESTTRTSLTDDTPPKVAKSAGGKRARVLFDADSGDDISLGLTGTQFESSLWLRLFSPQGEEIAYFSAPKTGAFDRELNDLPASGTYSLVIEDGGAGSTTVTLSKPLKVAALDASATTPTEVALSRAGQRAETTFRAESGDDFSVGMLDSTYTGTVRLNVTDPDGQRVGWGGSVYPGQPSDSYGMWKLPKSGTYTITINPEPGVTGKLGLLLSKAVTVSPELDGASAKATITRRGQVAGTEFVAPESGLAGAALTGNTLSETSSLILVDSKGAEIEGSSVSKTKNGELYLEELAAGERYRVFWKPGNTALGEGNLWLSSSITTEVLAKDGDTGDGELTRPGQQLVVPVDAAAGDGVSVLVGENTALADLATTVTVYPNGYVYDNLTLVGTGGGDIVLPAPMPAGRYQVLIRPSDASAVGTVPVSRIEGVNAGELAVGGAKQTATITKPGQFAYFSIEVEADVTPELLIDTPAPFKWVALTVGSDGGVRQRKIMETTTASLRLQAFSAGRYVLAINPGGLETGSITLGVRDVSSPTAQVFQDGDGRQASTTPRGPDVWTPGKHNLAGHGWSTHKTSDPAAAAGLKASSGTTGLSGRVMRLDSKPLKGVTVTAGKRRARTDAKGRFLLGDIPDGTTQIIVDGSTANTAKRQYGRFHIRVHPKPGRTTDIGFPVWMTPLDTKHTVKFDAPTKKEVVLRTPKIPGLEVRIPKGTVVRDEKGRPVTRLGITAIPIDRPPFPLPKNSVVPVYFTVQPGGTYVFPKGAQVTYPNYTKEAPGTRVEFMDYDPKKKGWHVYGHGRVSPDGKRVVPDKKTRVWSFHGAMFNISDLVPWDLPWLDDVFDWVSGDPVSLSTGMLTDSRTDLGVSDPRGSADITRTYWQGDTKSRAFGVGRDLSYNAFLHSKKEYEQVDLYLPGGQSVHFERTSAGTGYSDAVFEPATPSAFNGAKIKWNDNSGWDLTFRDGTVWVFPQYAPLKEIRDRHGNSTKITRSGGSKGQVTRITTPGGRWISLTYDSNKRVTAAKDNTGRSVGYTYDAKGRLETVTDPAGKGSSYTYDGDSNRIATAKDARGITYMTNTFDTNGRVKEQTLTEGAKYTFAYTTTGDGKITATEVTQPGGAVRKVEFDTGGYGTSDTAAYGTSLARKTTYQRGTNHRIDTVIDPYGRRTELSYDANGHITSATKLAGTADARSTGTTIFDGPYDQPTKSTDALGNTTLFGYDADGNLKTVTDPEARKTDLTYAADGQVKTVTDNAGAVTEYDYRNGDLVTVKNAEGGISSRFTDAAGRPAALTDEAGATTTIGYDKLNQPKKLTGPLGHTTDFDYDDNGNLTALTDARNNVTTWAYDNADRPKSAADPLGAQATFGYDTAGRLKTVTSRSGQVATAEYDLLGRTKKTRYGVDSGTGTAESEFSYDYDVVDLLKRAGNQTFTYDKFDRTKSVTGPTGTVGYDYDDADRRTEMTAAGVTTTYGYDKSSILKSVNSGSQEVTFGLDAAGRETTAALPGGITRTTGYDKTGTITSLAYTHGTDNAKVGDLTYTRDARGLQQRLTGSLAKVALPPAESGTTFGKDNRIGSYAGRTFSYDKNGQLSSDGVRDYTWNARGQLKSLTKSGQTSTFTYDPSGGRVGKTGGAGTKKYLTDASNPLAEQNASGATTATVATSGLDQFLTRTENGATQTYLTDALGSVIGLADADGKISTTYTYDPNGTPTAAGSATSNPYTFTGREDDGTGLLYYRNRYYDPQTGRFISQDPIGHAGGTNLYQYALSSPTTYTDPTGNSPMLAGCVAGGLIDGGADWLTQRLSGRKVNWGQVGTAAAIGCLTGMLGPGLGTAAKGKRAGNAAACLRNSFTPDTPVLMADGTRKPIKDVQPGDKVKATDPETGETGTRTVTAHITGTGEKHLVDITIDTGGRGGSKKTASITATDGHPFWVPNLHRWLTAAELKVGQWLRTSTGTWAQITAVKARTQRATVHNLTVHDLHTYFVVAGQVPILVHNINSPSACGPNGEPIYDIPIGSSGGPGAGNRIPADMLRDYNVGVNANPNLPTPLCSYCRANPAQAIDHVQPRIRGGDLTDANTTPACRSCNSSKRDHGAPLNPPAGYTGPWPPPHWPPHIRR